MIPDESQIRALWDKCNLPDYKRRHVELVAKVARFLAKQCQMLPPFAKATEGKNDKCQINEKLLVAGAMLHDIDKNIARLAGEEHPDTGVRILKEEGMTEVANLVKTHPLHAILEPAIAPKTWEEKILYLADKMVKLEIISVDKRFALWRDENLPAEAIDLLNRAYPKVKQLEKEIFGLIKIEPDEVSKLID